jgi:hypothetical protein
MAAYAAVPSHSGEQAMSTLMHQPPREDSPTSPFLTYSAALLVQTSPLLAVGTLDSEGRVWTTLFGGEAGFARAINNSMLGVKAAADGRFDPVVDALLDGKRDREAFGMDDGSGGRVVAGLAIDLETRRRVKFMGRAIGASFVANANGEEGSLEQTRGELRAVIKVENSLGKSVTSMPLLTGGKTLTYGL